MTRRTGLAEDIRLALERTTGAHVTGVTAVGGGCICPAYHVTLARGAPLFVKTAPVGAPDDLFAEEARSLATIAATGSVRVPHVIAAAPGWLALEWLDAAGAGTGAWTLLGEALAALHRHTAPEYGWISDNYIGPLPQRNARMPDWPEFWRDRRLLPQLRPAARRLDGDTVRQCERLCAQLEERLGGAAEDGASLLHGDLWSGNVHMTAAGPAVVDPASYHGHRVVDVAMAALFGGFDQAFFRAYESAWPLLPGAAARRPIYQLYYLLVHVNLFGSSYAAQTRHVLRSLSP